MGNHHMKGARIRHSQVLLHPIRSENLLTELSVIAPVNFKTIQADIIILQINMLIRQKMNSHSGQLFPIVLIQTSELFRFFPGFLLMIALA